MAREEASSGSGNTRILVILGIALVLGIVALFGVYSVIQGYQATILEAQKPEATVIAIVAARDLYQGVEITEEDLYAVEIPPQYLNEAIYQSPEHVVGRVPRERILANEFLREERLADAKAGIGLNAIIPRGRRAVSINVSDAFGVSGFLNPGNYVDLLVTIENRESGAGSKSENTETKTVLQAVYVLAVDTRTGSKSTPKEGEETEQTIEEKQAQRRLRPSVTLSVTPEEAEQVAFAESQGTITLSLRNDLDVEDQTLGTGVTDESIIEKDGPKTPEVPVTPPTGHKKPPVEAPPPKEKCHITQIKAGQTVEIPIECPQ
jgi:pilus assembly protein CpaB